MMLAPAFLAFSLLTRSRSAHHPRILGTGTLFLTG